MLSPILHEAAAGALLLAVLACVIARPRGLDVAWPAGIGAALAIVLGLLTLPALTTIFGDVWDAAATLIALFILSEALDSNGFFTWAALHLARFARGSGWRLYAMVLLLTTGVTALLANDGAVLMLTPIFARLLLKIYPDEKSRLPYVFAAGFFADTMSGIFLPSNLTNIVIADSQHLTFAQVAKWMIIPTIAAFFIGGAAFATRFRTRLGKPYDMRVLDTPASALRDPVIFWAGWITLGGLVIGYIVGNEIIHLPVSVIAGAAAIIMLALVQARCLRSAPGVLAGAPWGILVYAIGMFVVITAAYDGRVLAFLTHPLRANVVPTAGAAGALFSGGILALLSAAVNNLPATLIGVLSLHAALVKPAHLAIYAIILGVDIGPKLTPYGSLATLLWMGILDKNGIHVSWGHYLRENWWVAALTLGAAFGGLLVASLLFI